MQEQSSVMQCRCACAVDAVRLGLSGFRKVAHLHGSKPCHESFDGRTPESKLHHPIKMCGSRGSSVQCTSHATIFLLNINIWLYIHIFDYTYQWICGLDDRQMLACGSLQAVISQSHKPDHREGAEPQRRFRVGTL